jgi:hypothetical protein
MATGAAEFIDVVTADVFIPEIWSKYAVIARESKCVFAGLVDRRFEKDVMQMGDTVNIPNISNVGVVAKSLSANAATLYETVTETKQQLTIGTWNYTAIAIETATKKQVDRNLLAAYAPKQQYALTLAIDDALAAYPDDFSQSVGTLLVPLTYDDVLRAKQYLDDADVPMSDRNIVISPAQEAEFRKLDQFINRDYNSLQEGLNLGSREAYLGTWMDIPVYRSTNVEGSNAAGHDNTMFHKEALALVVQMDPTTHNFFDIDYFAYKVAVEQLHGSKEIRDDHGVWMPGA